VARTPWQFNYVLRGLRACHRKLSAYRPKPRLQRLVVHAQPLPLFGLVRLRRGGGFGFAAEFAGVDGGHEVAERVEGVIVVVERSFGFAGVGALGVAVAFGFAEEVGAGAVDDAERAVLQAGADGGNGEAEVIDAYVDATPGEAITKARKCESAKKENTSSRRLGSRPLVPSFRSFVFP
jgi:hypothetical protein